MKKILLSVLMGLMGLSGLRAQTLVDNYRFSTRVDPAAWIDITGVDSALIATPDSGVVRYGNSAVTNIGFTIPFGEFASGSQFSVNLNGTLRLGSSVVPVSSQTNPLTRSGWMPMVNAYGAAGEMDSTCHLRCALLGTEGSRVLVVEARLKVFNVDSSYVSWQVQLYEATSEVLIVYGPSENSGGIPATQPGLAKSIYDILFIDHASHSVQRYTNTSVPTNGAGVWPEAWRCYSFVPDMAVCPYPPAVSKLEAPLDSVRLAWSGVSGGTAWRLTIPLVGIDTVLTDTSLTFGGLEPCVDFTGTLRSICGGDSSLRSRPFSFTSGCGTVRMLPWMDDYQLAAGDACWQKPYTTSARSWRRVSSGNNYYMRVPNGYSTTTYNEWLVSPSVVLPDTVGLTLGWWYKSSKISNGAPQVRVRLLVCDTSDEVDTSAAWVTLCTIDQYEQYFQQHYAILDAWAGHRVRVAFQRVGQGGGTCDVDNVGIEVRTQPSVVMQAPSMAHAGDTTTIASVLTAGLLSNPVYDWHSTMEEQGLANRLTDDDTLRFIYLGSGIDTVTFTLTTDYGTATATAVIVVKDCRPVTLFPWSEGFEYGLDCWETPTGYRSWTTTNNSYEHGGAYCLKSNTTSSQSSLIVSQAVVVPSDAYMLRLGLWARLSGPSSTSIYRSFSVLIAGADCSDWSTATVLGTASANVQYRYFEFPLDAYAGQTVRFALRHGDSYYSALVDDISIRYTREPVVSLATSAEQLYGEDTVTASVTLTEGDTVGISYHWSSAMADHGLADYIGSGAQMRFAYHGVGLDTIVVTVSNAYGSATDTAVVRVCAVQDTLPYVADFGNDLPCWQVLDGTCSVHSSGYLSFEDWPTAVAMPPVWIPDDGNVVLEYDCAYSFFYGSTMVMVTTDMVSFDTLSVIPFTNGTHPSTRIPLGAYAGQRIRVVFKATGQFLQYYLTHVNIRYALEPVVQAVADDGYFPGTPVTLTASLLEGDTTSLTYAWTSTLTQSGDATLTFDGGPQATLVPSVGGPDTVTVWATNNYGTDSATLVVNIKPCGVVDTLPWVEDFSNQFACWWQPAGSLWSPDNTGVMACVIKAATTGDNWLISRAIELPMLSSVEGEGMQLWWDAAAIFANGHTYSVWITTGDYRDTGSYTQLATYSGNLPTYNSGWRTPRVDLSAYAGDTIHLAFRYQTQYYEVSSIPGILAIDSVRIFDTRPPEVAIVPPARCFVDDTVAYCPEHVHGVRSGMTRTWRSTMALQGLATTWVVDSLFYVVYHAAGYDTVSLVATNAYGSDTAMAWRQVKDCPAVTVPWLEDFEALNPCWSGSWTRNQMTFLWNDSTTYVVHSNPNSWYVSPWIDLPDTVGLQLMWNKWNGGTFMMIVVSPTGSIEPADLTDTLLYRETPQGYDSLSLDAYAGRRIRVAFSQSASSAAYDSYALDDIRVDYNRTVPQVSLTAPSVASSFGDTLTATATLGNNAVGVHYAWHSTLLDSTIATIAPMVSIAYTVAGTDTITVIAANVFGCDTAWAVVTVNDCSGMLTVPFFEDFNSITATSYNVPGWIPPCWSAVWNGSILAYAPHVIDTGDYRWLGDRPDNALFLVAGTDYGIDTGYDTVAEVKLPRFADSLHQLMIAFDYRFESATAGNLIVGYYEDAVFYPVQTMTPHAGSYRRDTVSFSSHLPAINSRMAIRWQQNNILYFAAAIDNIEVFSNSDPTPHAIINGPTAVTVYDTALFSATLALGDTTGLTYTWHSSLTGQSATGSHWPLVYTTDGIDTISLTATNAYGSQTITKTVTVTGAPQVTIAGPAAGDTYDTLVFIANIISGTTAGLTYTWHSTLQDTTIATMDSILSIAYTTPGTDTLTMVAANAFGADTASMVVSVTYVPLPGSPVVSLQGYTYATLCDSASFGVTLLEGDTAGLTFSWHSSLMDTTIVTIAPIVTIAYDAIGFDTITVTAANMYGHRSASATTRVLECELRDTPFEATLTAGGSNIYAHFLDWQRGGIAYPRGNLRSNVGWHPVDNSWSITLDGRNCMESHKSDYGDATGDHWLISPPIRLPESSTDTLAWNAYCGYTTYHVLLSPTEYVVNPDGNIDRSYFTDTLYSETGFSGWTRREVDLSAYAGRTVHLAFVHSGPASDAAHASGYVAAVDTVRLWSTAIPDTTPVPPDTVWHIVTVNAVMNNGSQQDGLDEMVHGAGTYMDGDTVTLEGEEHGCATSFVYWITTEGDTLFDNPYTFIIHSDVTLTAVFAIFGGIDDVEGTAFTLHPNPAHDEVTVSVSQPSTLTVLDMAGRVVIPATPVTSELRIPTSEFPAGVYFVRIGEGVKKLIVR